MFHASSIDKGFARPEAHVPFPIILMGVWQLRNYLASISRREIVSLG
jgi:hypothetical protein